MLERDAERAATLAVRDYTVDALGAERTAELRAAGAASTLDELLESVASGT